MTRAGLAALTLCALGLAGCGGGDGPSVPSASPAPPGTGTTTAGSTPARPVPAPRSAEVDRLTLPQQVGETLILAFAGTEAPPYVLGALRERRVAGVILFRGNVQSPGQLRGLTAQLQRAAGGRAIVCLDQEGGDVKIVSFAAPDTSQREQGSAQAAGAAARATARDLHSLGVNVNLAPVADVGRPGSALEARTYPGDGGAVAAGVAAAVRAHRSQGVGATVKHFPGLGAAGANTDDEPVTTRTGAADLRPYRAAIAAEVPLVMASHATYPQLDPGRIASQSPVILEGLLRRRLRFGGVIVTDSMEAAAVLAEGSLEQGAERSLRAGADLLLLTGDGSFRPVSQRLNAVARRDPAFRARVKAAAARVLALKARLGLGR